MGFVRPDLAPNGTKWSADGGHSGGQAYKTVGFWVGIMCGLGFIGLAVYWLYLKRHYERVAVERPRARATVARVAQKLDEVPTEMRHSIAKSECSICLSRRAEFGAAPRRGRWSSCPANTLFIGNASRTGSRRVWRACRRTISRARCAARKCRSAEAAARRRGARTRRASWYYESCSTSKTARRAFAV